jgi:hypothetical protein
VSIMQSVDNSGVDHAIRRRRPVAPPGPRAPGRCGVMLRRPGVAAP